MTETAIAILLIVIVGGGIYMLGTVIGSHRQDLQWAQIAERGNRYRHAVQDLIQWCQQSPHARLIATHLSAIGEGLEINTGTPVGVEACDVMGLRQQLQQLDDSIAHPTRPVVAERTTPDQAIALAKAVGADIEQWMTVVPKPFQVHISPEQLATLIDNVSRREWLPMDTEPQGASTHLVLLPGRRAMNIQVKCVKENGYCVIGGAFGFDLPKPLAWAPLDLPAELDASPESSL